MMKRSIAVAAMALALLAGGSGSGGAEEAAPGVSMEAMVAEALDRSAELKALQERIAAAEAMVGPAGALPDPMASVGLMNIPVGSGVSLDKHMMSGLELMLSQHVPASAKRRLRREVQGQEAEMLRAGYAAKRNEIVREVKQAYYDVQYLDGALEVVGENKRVAEDLLKSAEARYATGMGLQQDVFKAQVRLSQMIDMLLMLRQQRAMAAVRLNRLRYRPGEEEIPTLPLLAGIATTEPPRPVGAAVEAGNPHLREMRLGVERARSKAVLAAEGIHPDFTFGFQYMVRQSIEMGGSDGTDTWSATIGLNLPWLYRRDKVDREVEAARSEVGAADAGLSAMRNELTARAEELGIELARTEQQLSLVETALLPQAEGALASSWKAYGSGQLELMSVLDNQMSLYNLQLQRLGLMAQHERAAAELEYLVGRPLGGEAEVSDGAG